mgnify:CR=1 FL=1|tara:strand:- start:1913 stop:2185 length:273 start_codon:yes stop_codon:yes gene_type:complete
MIDTDKYEGHYKGSWANQYGDVVKLVYPNESSPSLDADQRLIIDAPLLLSEVKRLREGIKEQMQFALDCVGSDIGDLYETIADDLRRLIE